MGILQGDRMEACNDAMPAAEARKRQIIMTARRRVVYQDPRPGLEEWLGPSHNQQERRMSNWKRSERAMHGKQRRV